MRTDPGRAVSTGGTFPQGGGTRFPTQRERDEPKLASTATSFGYPLGSPAQAIGTIKALHRVFALATGVPRPGFMIPQPER